MKKIQIHVDLVLEMKLKRNMSVFSRSILQLPGASPMLATFALGRAHRSALLKEAHNSDPLTTIVVTDFADVYATTGSYLKGLLFDVSSSEDRVHAPTFFPSGLSPEVSEELKTVCLANGLVTLEVIEHSRHELTKARIVGPLDDSLIRTISHLLSQGEASASDIANAAKDNVHPTAWNNRLAELYRRNLVARWKVGKQWIFKFLAKEIAYG